MKQLAFVNISSASLLLAWMVNKNNLFSFLIFHAGSVLGLTRKCMPVFYSYSNMAKVKDSKIYVQ